MTEFVAAILIVSIVLQVSAALAAILQVRHAGRRYRFAWVCVSTALLLMVERRVEPLIFLTEESDLRLANNIFGLLISITMAIGIFGLQSLFKTIQQQDEMLKQLAATDPLTGLANRRSFNEWAQREIRLSLRNATPLSLLMIDLDHFKEVNDRFGHPEGDAVLVRVTEKLRACLRNVDHIGRWGGEEFVVLLPELDGSGALRVAERVCAEIAEKNDGQVGITVSIGVTVFHPESPTQDDIFSSLIEQADSALYCAKQEGRHCVRIYSPSIQAH